MVRAVLAVVRTLADCPRSKLNETHWRPSQVPYAAATLALSYLMEPPAWDLCYRNATSDRPSTRFVLVSELSCGPDPDTPCQRDDTVCLICKGSIHGERPSLCSAEWNLAASCGLRGLTISRGSIMEDVKDTSSSVRWM